MIVGRIGASMKRRTQSNQDFGSSAAVCLHSDGKCEMRFWLKWKKGVGLVYVSVRTIMTFFKFCNICVSTRSFSKFLSDDGIRTTKHPLL